MTVTAVRKDPEALTLIVTAEFDASPERVWDLWADPRKLERWWGPPTYPATFDSHDLAPGSRVAYHMTGPTGDQPRGYWDVVEVDPPVFRLFDDLKEAATLEALGYWPEDFAALDDAMQALAVFDERKSRVVELRFFGGLTVEETASVLNVSVDTVMRDWRLAKVWLRREMRTRSAWPHGARDDA